jgi:hypothetical protein
MIGARGCPHVRSAANESYPRQVAQHGPLAGQDQGGRHPEGGEGTAGAASAGREFPAPLFRGSADNRLLFGESRTSAGSLNASAGAMRAGRTSSIIPGHATSPSTSSTTISGRRQASRRDTLMRVLECTGKYTNRSYPPSCSWPSSLARRPVKAEQSHENPFGDYVFSFARKEYRWQRSNRACTADRDAPKLDSRRQAGLPFLDSCHHRTNSSLSR